MLPPDKHVFEHMDGESVKDLLKGIDPGRTALYTLCAQKQIGITTMKSLGSGKLVSPEHTPFAKPMSVAQCVNYALSRPGVASVLLGAKTAAEMHDALNYYNLSDAEKDYAGILSDVRNDFTGKCVYCSHCQPCPAQIDISAVHKYLDIAKLTPDCVPPSVRSHYQSMASRGGKCTGCGHCESRCPFGVPIIENMAQADKLLG
jgi:hypothetical protein